MDLAKVTVVTHCDRNYLAKAYSLIRSLRDNSYSGVIVVICHDKDSFEKLSRLNLPQVLTYSIFQVEDEFPQLLAARSNRSLHEYFFCVTPFLIKFVMLRFDSNLYVYLDSDLFFFSDFTSALDSNENYVVAITPHRYKSSYKHLEIYGKYNVGLLSVRPCPDSQNIIDWWAKQCIKSTSINAANDVYGDQKYLDEFETLIRGVKSLDNLGHNVAPWNFTDVVQVDGELKIIANLSISSLVYFHFSGLKRYRYFSLLGFMPFRQKATKQVKTLIYQPYLKSLRESEYKLGINRGSEQKKIGLVNLIHSLRYSDLTFNPRLKKN